MEYLQFRKTVNSFLYTTVNKRSLLNSDQLQILVNQVQFKVFSENGSEPEND